MVNGSRCMGCMYCYNGLCFKAGRSDAEPELLAIPCDGCAEKAEPTAAALYIIV